MAAVWKKRLARTLDPVVARFLSSIKDDEHLILYDIAASRAHVRMLKKQCLISAQEYTRIDRALRSLNARYARGKMRLRESHEDVHMNIENMVKRIAGKPADKLHMARSRNDLVATDMRLYVRQETVTLLRLVTDAEQALLQHARVHRDVILPGYTHLQQAQPVSWAFYLLSIIFKLQRDADRLCDAYRRINVSPLGACALAGTAHRIDPEYTAALLGFSGFADNCMDAVGDRDFLCETAYICAQTGGHLASFATDLVIYATQEFALVELDDAIATGSSIMPHKKNPDIFELLRARSASLIGYVVSLFSVLQGLPGSYNRDHQDTKKIIFDCFDATCACLSMIPAVISKVHPVKTSWAARPAFCCATNLVDYAAAHTHTFRQAYHIVAECAQQADHDMAAFIHLCAQRLVIAQATVERLLTPAVAVRAKRSRNSTGTRSVHNQLKRAQRCIERNERRIRTFRRAMKC